jgi:hypothetical protein
MSRTASGRGGDSGVLNAETLLRSAGVGTAAYLVTYVLTFLLANGEITSQFGDTDIPSWKAALWYHYSAHFVEVAHSASVFGFSDSGTTNLVTSSDAAAVSLLLVVPPLVLLLAGGLAARAANARAPGVGGVTGALVVSAYLVLAVGGALVAAYSSSGVAGEVSFRIPVGRAAATAGLAYPVVFGGVGGALATQFGR